MEWPGFPGPLLHRVSQGRGPQQDTWVQVPTVVQIHKMTLDNFPPTLGLTFPGPLTAGHVSVYGCSLPSPAQKATCLMHAKTFSEALLCTGPVTGPGDTRVDEALLSPMGDISALWGGRPCGVMTRTQWAEGLGKISTGHCRTQDSVHFGGSGELPMGLGIPSLGPQCLLHHSSSAWPWTSHPLTGPVAWWGKSRTQLYAISFKSFS